MMMEEPIDTGDNIPGLNMGVESKALHSVGNG